jgi:hypothetical protein
VDAQFRAVMHEISRQLLSSSGASRPRAFVIPLGYGITVKSTVAEL